jgi:hypothetical protein
MKNKVPALPFLVSTALVLTATLMLACGGGKNSNGGINAVTVSISASPTTVDLGETVTLSWSSTNATSCLATSAPPEADWIAAVGTSGTATVTPPSFANELYSLTCIQSASGQSQTSSVSVTVNSAATGIENDVISSGGYTTFKNLWSTNSCVLDGTTLTNLTIVGPSNGIGSSDIWLGVPIFGYSTGSPGGVGAGWTATQDGTGLLITYSPGGGSCERLPVSILNIAGSTASGGFSADLVDGTGTTAACTFSLIPPSGNGPSFEDVNCGN